MRKYAVLTMDVVGSRGFESARLLSVLHRCIDDVNDKFSRDVAVKFSIVLGDTIQGVCSRVRRAYDIFQWFEELLWLEGKSILKKPVYVRCGMGIGGIVDISRPAGEQTGEAFSFASEALDKIKGCRDSSCVSIVASNKELSELISAAFGIAQALKNGWSKRMREVVLLAREAKSQTQVANKLGLTRGDVKKILVRAGYKRLREFERQVARILPLI